MGHGKPGESWNFKISFSRPGKSWNLGVGQGKSWKMILIVLIFCCKIDLQLAENCEKLISV